MKLTPILLFFYLANASFVYPTNYLQTLTDVQIREKISIYSLAIDTKNFALLSEVFAENITANFSLPPPNELIHGLAECQQVLKASLKDYVTQHTISTTVVDFTDETSPNSTAYLVANYFGKGNLTGQILGYYGTYEDTWAFESGSWKSSSRTLSLFGPGAIGNLAVVGPSA